MSQDLSEKFEHALAQSNAAEFDKIETRACSSDNFDGVQYSIHGSFIPIRPIIDVVAEEDGLAIEQLFHSEDGQTRLGVFVAEIPEQSHPAFI